MADMHLNFCEAARFVPFVVGSGKVEVDGEGWVGIFSLVSHNFLLRPCRITHSKDAIFDAVGNVGDNEIAQSYNYVTALACTVVKAAFSYY